VSCPPISDAFLAPATVDETWRALLAKGVHSDDVAAHLRALGVDGADVEHAPLALADLDVFPRVNLGDDVNAPTCTKDMPLRTWLKSRLRERGPAVVFPLRSLARDVVCNLHIRYLRDGRRDLLRGAGLRDGDTPIVFGRAHTSPVTVVGGLEAWLAARARGEVSAVGALDDLARDDVAAWLRAQGLTAT
jgi:hypothetical protein